RRGPEVDHPLQRVTAHPFVIAVVVAMGLSGSSVALAQQRPMRSANNQSTIRMTAPASGPSRRNESVSRSTTGTASPGLRGAVSRARPEVSAHNAPLPTGWLRQQRPSAPVYGSRNRTVVQSLARGDRMLVSADLRSANPATAGTMVDSGRVNMIYVNEG